MSTQYVSVKVGHGKEVHAGVQIRVDKKGRFEYPVYSHLCGSGNSSAMHSLRSASVRKTNGEITCKKCLASMEDR